MKSPVMGCHCSKTMTIIPSSTSSASTSLTSSACFRTCKTTQSLRKPTSIIMSASVLSSVMGPRYTVSQRSSWPTLRCQSVHRQDDPRTAGALDTYFRDALQTYADVAYKDRHDYLARRFHAWYAKLKPSSSAVVSAGDSELGAMVSVEGVDGATPPAKRPLFSLTLNDVSAAPAAAGPAALAVAGAAPPEEGGEDPTAKERSGPSSPVSWTGVSSNVGCAKNSVHCNLCPVPSSSYSSPGKETPISKNIRY